MFASPPRSRRITTRLVDEQGLANALSQIGANSPDSAAAHHARAFVDIKLAVWQMNSSEEHARSLNRATWALAAATVLLALATIALLVVTARHGG
jgi:hypothetical protein